MNDSKVTYRVASCASGCAYHSTVGGTCGMCGGSLTEPRAMAAAGTRALFLGGERYDAGKAEVLAWLNAR